MRIGAALLSILLLSAAAFAADVTGTWQITISNTSPDGAIHTDSGLASLKQSGDVLTGWLGPGDGSQQMAITVGTIKENKVTIKVMPRPDRTMTFELTLNGEKLIGTVERTGDDRKGTVEFVRSVQK